MLLLAADDIDCVKNDDCCAADENTAPIKRRLCCKA